MIRNEFEIKDKILPNSNQSVINRKVYEKPMTCPNCNYGTDSNIVTTWIADTSDGLLLVMIHECTSCDYKFHVNYLWNSAENKFKFVSIYPAFIEREFGELIKKTSPKFIELYNQASKAEFNGSIDLAGCGYRNAMEILIKDYAINCLGKDQNEVAKMKLANAIETYLPNYDYKSVADVVRILGNDTTHYEKKYEEMDFTILKQYLEIFVDLIDVQLKMKNPPVKRDNVKKTKEN